MPEVSYSTVRALKAQDSGTFTSLLVVKKLTPKTASNGNPYLSLEFGDRSGSFFCTLFSDNPSYDAFKAISEGAIAKVEGKIDYYQGKLSPKIARATVLAESELPPEALEGLVEVSPEDPKGLWSEVEAFVASIKHAPLKATVQAVFDELGESFKSAPAAVSMHHAYRHGLLEHTTRMARAAKALLPLYPEVDGDLVMAGILLHDTGKVIEYEGTLATKRSRRGILQGHVVLGYQLARKAAIASKLDADRTERLEHIILSHQGELEWGAAAMAATPEAVLVSMIDNLDAKMGMVQHALRQTSPDAEFSEKILGLKAPLLTRPIV